MRIHRSVHDRAIFIPFAPSFVTQVLCSNCKREVPENYPVCVHCGASVPISTPGSSETADDDQHVFERLTAALSPTYDVIRLIGRGGFCDVFEIYDTHLDRRLAVKVLRADLAWAPGMIPRFEREAMSLAKLNHPHIPPLYFVGEHDGLAFFAMPYIEGRSLGQLLAKDGPMDPERLIEIMLPVLDALEFAHRHGIIHRDIKPDNIVIDNASGRPLLLDFGLAKQMAARPGSSLPGLVMGTPAYTSPEQVLGQPGVDHRSDIYGLGSTMFHLLTGTTIVTGDTPHEIIGRQLDGEIPDPASLNPMIPAWLSAAILCALARLPEDRFQSAAAMADALKAGGRARISGAASPGGASRHIRHNDPTPPMLPVTVAEPFTRRATPERLRRHSDPNLLQRSWPVRFWRLLPFVLLAGAVAWYALTPVRAVIVNRMVLPIEIFTEEGVNVTLAPEGEYYTRVGDDGKVLVNWRVVQPAADGGLAIRLDPVEGVLRVDIVNFIEFARKRVRRDIDSWLGAQRSYAPRITNAMSRPLRVELHPRGLSYYNLMPGETRVLGYFTLSDSSAIHVFPGEGGHLILRDIARRVSSASGLLDLTVENGSFSMPAGLPPAPEE